MRRLLQKLFNSRLRSLECMVYAMSLFVIFGVFYSLGQLHLQQQFYRGLGHPAHQIPEGRKVLSFFKRSSGNSEEDSEDTKNAGRYGWRDKPYAISQEHWKSLLQNDIPDDSVSNAAADRGTLLDEIDGYNAFVSFDDLQEDKKTTQRSQHNSLRSSLNDLIHPQQPVVQGQGHSQMGQGSMESPHHNVQIEFVEAPKPQGLQSGVEVHESFLVHKILPKDSSHDTPNGAQHQRDRPGGNIFQSEVEVGDSTNGKEIKDSEIDLPWLVKAKDPGIHHEGFAKQAEVVSYDVNAGAEASNSVNIAGNSGKAMQWQQQSFVDHEDKNTLHNKGHLPQTSKGQYISKPHSDHYSDQSSHQNQPNHAHRPHVRNQGNNLQQQQQYHGNGASQQLRRHYNDKHEVIKRDVTGIQQHPDGSVATDHKDAAAAAVASSYGRKGVVMESKQMPSWQVLAKIEQDLEQEGHKMQMQMLRYVMHNSTSDANDPRPHAPSLQVNRGSSNNGQQVVIVPQSSPYQSNSGSNTQYNEILKEKLRRINPVGQASDQSIPNNKMQAQGNQPHKSNKTRGSISNRHHHSHHHHHHHNQDGHQHGELLHSQDGNNGNKEIPIVNYAGQTVAKARAMSGQVNRQNARQRNSSSHHEIQFDHQLSAEQPKIYMDLLGRMGNHLFHLASLYGIARKTQHTPVVSPGAYILEAFDAQIKDVFMVDEPPSNILTLHEEGSGVFTSKVYQLPPNTDVQLCCYFQSWRYFVQYSSELRQIFTFKPWITARAQAILNMAKRDYMNMQFGKQLPKYISHTVTYVGVHVRRSDHLLTEHLKKGYKPASLSYFNKAMDYYRQKYANVYFIVCSDEIEWAKDHLRDNDVYFVEGQDGLIDLGVLAACNHTVTSVGTFSWWAGWLAGGEVTYYSDWPIPGTEIDKNYKHYDYFMPHWKPFGD